MVLQAQVMGGGQKDRSASSASNHATTGGEQCEDEGEKT